MDRLNLEKAFVKTENTLSKISAVPVIGTVAGVVKVALGILQFLSGVFLRVFSAEYKNIGTSYLIHGGENVLVGLIESMPIIGTLLYYCREQIIDTLIVNALKDKESDKYYSLLSHSQRLNFVCYKTIFDEDVRINNRHYVILHPTIGPMVFIDPPHPPNIVTEIDISPHITRC